MRESKPPQITPDTPIGPDADLAREDIRLADGSRLTGEAAGQIVDDVRRATGRPAQTGRRKNPRERLPRAADIADLDDPVEAYLMSTPADDEEILALISLHKAIAGTVAREHEQSERRRA